MCVCVCVCVWCRGEDAQGGVDGCTDGIRFLGWMIGKRSAIAERESFVLVLVMVYVILKFMLNAYSRGI